MRTILTLASVAVLAAGCAQTQQLATALSSPTSVNPIATGSVTPAAERKRERPVVAGRPARMYIFAGFKEETCEPVEASLSLTSQPQKGTVEFRAGQMTTITQSASGKCLGTKLPGTAVYYTANAGTLGSDSFTVQATTPTGSPTSKTFALDIDN